MPAHWRSVPYGFPLRNQRYRVWTTPAGTAPTGWPASCGSAAPAWRSATAATRSAPPGSSSGTTASAGTAPATWAGTGRTGRWSSWAGATSRSRSGGTGSSWARSRRRARRIPGAPGGRVHHRRGGGAPARRRRWSARTDTAGLRAVPRRAAAGVHGAGAGSVLTEALPLSANGKVDRRPAGRPRRRAPRPTTTSHRRATPRSGSPSCGRSCWSATDVGRGQSFFALGGDSLLATRLVEGLRQRYGVPLSLRQLFAAPTVAQLAAVVDAERGADSGDFEEGVL